MATGFKDRSTESIHARFDLVRCDEVRVFRRKVLLCLAILLLLMLSSLLIITYVTSTVTTNDTFLGRMLDIPTAFSLVQHALQDGPLSLQPLGTSAPYESEALRFAVMLEGTRIAMVGVVMVSGILLGLSGMLFQNVFRNPIASPTILGVQSGVSIGVFVLVIVFGSAAVEMTGVRYMLCYGCGVILLLITLAGGRCIGGRRSFSVVDMLLVGITLGAIVGIFIQYMPQMMDDTTWILYYSISEMVSTDTSTFALISLVIVFLVTVVPTFLLRWRLNALSFSDVEVRMLGINPTRLRIVALLCGSLMTLAALVTVGMVGMAAIIVPFVARYLFGSETREQFWGCVLLGPIILLLCRNICDLLQTCLPVLGASLSIGTTLSVLMIPLFIWIVVTGQRGWE